MRFKGRVLGQQNVYSNIRAYESESNADWILLVRSNPVFTCVKLSRWVILYPQQNESEVRAFVKSIRQVAQGMSFNIPQPEL